MKRILFLLLFFQLWLVSAFGQELIQGIPYQAVARDASGMILADSPLQVSLVFTDGVDGVADFYSEQHEVQTDENGFFQLEIGKGDSRNGYLSDVPWSTSEVWLKITMNSVERSDLAVRRTIQLFSVPYALFAESANKLTEPEDVDLRNQSIYWTSSGNVETRPPYHFLGNRDNKELVVKTAGDKRATFTRDGQLQILAGASVRGNDVAPGSYPVIIKGGNQGIYIKIDGRRSTANNFVTFADNTAKEIHGTIEGQTYTELITSPFYIIQSVLYAIEGANLVASGIVNGIKAVGFGSAAAAAYASLIFIFAGPGLTAAAVANGIKLGVDVASAAALLTNSISWAADQAANVGVSFTSGSADYAEYLPRASYAGDLEFGDIVGVRGGTVSKTTQDVDHLMVVSQNPGFLGNVPADGNTDYMEKIAFLGQVKVKVVGAVTAGDYILPSGNDDGVGIAVHPEDMNLKDYGRIVGVAWESAEEAPLNLVNCSIGMTQNEIAPRVEELSNKVDNIIHYLKGEGALRPETQNNPYLNMGASQWKTEKLFSDEEFDEIVDQNASYIRAVYAKVEKDVRASSKLDLATMPEFEAFLDDPVQQLKKMRRDPQYDAVWGELDQYLLQTFKLSPN